MPKILRPRACVNGVVESHLTAVREQLKKLLLLRLIFQVLEECRVNPRPLAGHKMRDRGCCLPYEVRSLSHGDSREPLKSRLPRTHSPGLDFLLVSVRKSHLGYFGLDRKSTRLNSSHPSISYA